MSPFLALALHPPHRSSQRELLTTQTPPTSLPCFRTFQSYHCPWKEPTATLWPTRPSDSALQTPWPHFPSLPASHFPLQHASCFLSPGHAGPLLASLPLLTLCSQPFALETFVLILESSSGSKCKPHHPPPPPPPPHQYPMVPSSISTLPPIPSQGSQTSSGVDVQGKEGIVGRKTRGRGGPSASPCGADAETRAPSGGHSAAQHSWQSWLRNHPRPCPANCPGLRAPLRVFRRCERRPPRRCRSK